MLRIKALFTDFWSTPEIRGAANTYHLKNAPLKSLGAIAFMADMDGLNEACYVRLDGATQAAGEDQQSQRVRVSSGLKSQMLTVPRDVEAWYAKEDVDADVDGTIENIGFSKTKEGSNIAIFWRAGGVKIKAIRMDDGTRPPLCLLRGGERLNLECPYLHGGDIIVFPRGGRLLVEKVVLDFEKLDIWVAKMVREIWYVGMLMVGLYAWECVVHRSNIGIRPFAQKVSSGWPVLATMAIWVWNFRTVSWLHFTRHGSFEARTLRGMMVSGVLVLACSAWEWITSASSGSMDYFWDFFIKQLMGQLWVAKWMIVFIGWVVGFLMWG